MTANVRFWMAALGAGALCAALYLTLTIGSLGAMVFAYVAQMPLFLAGLSLGAGASAVAASVAVGVMFLKGGVAFALIFLAMFLAPVVALVRQAMLSRRSPDGTVEWYPLGLLTGWLVGIGVAQLVVASLAMEFVGGMEELSRQIAGQLYDAVAEAMPKGAPTAGRERAVDQIAAFLPGTAVASLLCMTAVNGSLAQGLLQRFNRNARPAPDIALLDLPVHMVGGFALAAAAGLLLPGDFGYLARNLAAVILVGGLLGGLAVAHFAVRRLNGRPWMLVLLYAAAVVLFWPVLALAAIGLAEPFVGLKRRLARRV